MVQCKMCVETLCTYLDMTQCEIRSALLVTTLDGLWEPYWMDSYNYQIVCKTRFSEVLGKAFFEIFALLRKLANDFLRLFIYQYSMLINYLL